MKDIKKKQFTILGSISGWLNNGQYIQTQGNLEQIIELGNVINKEQIMCLRNMEYHSPEQKAYKQNFPCWFVGGLFPPLKTNDRDIKKLSNVMAIDVDYCDNPDMNKEWLKQTLFELPYTIMVADSISGKGLYQLILVEDGHFTPQYYEYIKKLYKQKYNINVDGVAKNIGRKRFISYDDKLLIKTDDIDIKPWKLKLQPEQKVQEITHRICDYKVQKRPTNTNIDLLDKTIKYLVEHGFSVDDFNTTEKYAVWYYVGCDFHVLSNGLDYFVKFSNNSNYHDTYEQILKKYNNGRQTDSLDNICKKYCGMMKTKYGSNWIKLIQ